jgi:hypothetical protein
MDLSGVLAGHAPEHDRTGDFPAKGIQAVHDAGLLTSPSARSTAAPAAASPTPSTRSPRSAGATRRSR